MINKNSRIFIAGASTSAGKALAAYLRANHYVNAVSDAQKNISLISESAVADFFKDFSPEYVFFTGAAAAGISSNQKIPADLCTRNLLAACHIFQSAVFSKVKKILYLSSSCTYPKDAPQPMKPEHLMTGRLEATSAAYATSKLAGAVLAQAYRAQYGLNAIVAVAADSYGPEDSFDPENSHVVSALIRKIQDAKAQAQPQVTLWGSGKPIRDFIFSEDLASACLFLMENYDSPEPVNLSANQPFSILALAEKIRAITAYEGNFQFDTSKPDGTPVKTLDSSALQNLGWGPRYSLQEGLQKTYEEYLKKCLLPV